MRGIGGRRLARAAVLLAVAAGTSCGKAPPRGLLLVSIDTCRADRIGCYGGPVETVTLDALAARGVRFADVSAPTPLTAPSHASLLTGLYPDRHGVRDNGAARLPAGAQSLAEILAGHGWHTGAFVSAFPLERRFGMDQGFAVYDDRLTGSAAREDGLDDSGRDAASRLFYDEREASAVVDAALPWLAEARRGERPWFAWIHFFDPHAAYRPPARFALRYGAGSYEGEIAYVDEQIGRVLDALGGGDVTVCVVADHGEALGEHGEATHGLFVYEGVIRVPWIVAGPGVPAGRTVEAPASLVDVAPTLLELLGYEPPPDADGESFVPRLDGAGTDVAPVFGECLWPQLHHGWAPLRYVRRGAWKLIDAPTPELYDVAADPAEARNLASARPDLFAELTADLERHAARGGTLAPEDVTLDEASRERLERLGYVGERRRPPAADPWSEGGRDPKEMVDFFNRLQRVPTLFLEGKLDEAQVELDALHAIDPGNHDVVLKLGLLARLGERWEDARRWALEAVRLAPEDPEARMRLAFALVQLGDREGARDQYREAIARRPDDADAWALLASLFSEDGLHADALLAFDRAVELAPDDAGLHAAQADALAAAGRAGAALAAYDRALSLDARLAPAVHGKARLLSREGRPREAADVLRAALPALGEDVDTLNNLAWILANESIDPAEAVALATRARALAPDDPVVLDTWGWSAVRAGRAAEAVAPLEAALRATGDPEVRAHLAAALGASGRDADARALARAAVAERPELERIPEVARLLR